MVNLDVVYGSAWIAFGALALDDGIAFLLREDDTPGQFGVKFPLIEHVCGDSLAVVTLCLDSREGEAEFDRIPRRTGRVVISCFLELDGRDTSVLDDRIEDKSRAPICDGFDALKSFRGDRFSLSQ